MFIKIEIIEPMIVPKHTQNTVLVISLLESENITNLSSSSKIESYFYDYGSKIEESIILKLPSLS